MKLNNFLLACGILMLTACVAQPETSSSSSRAAQASSQQDALSSSSEAQATSSALATPSSPPQTSSNPQVSSLPQVGSSASAPIMKTGQELYTEKCSICHDSDGSGIAGRAEEPLYGEQCHSCETPSALISEIEVTMPAGAAKSCTGECAQKIAEFIYEAFLNEPFNISCGNEIQKVSPMRRLNRTEIANAIEDVFNVEASMMREALEAETELIGGFATIGTALTTGTRWTENLLEGALLIADEAVDNGTFPQCSSASAPLVPIQPTLPECSTTAQCQNTYSGANDCNNGGGGICMCGSEPCWESQGNAQPDANACFDEAIAKAGKLLFRRALSTAEVERFQGISDSVASLTGNTANGHKAAIVALITSPKFVFSLAADNKAAKRSLTGREMADRLALTLWGSVPDETLIDLAAENKITGDELEKQIDRMLDDDRFDRFVHVFGDAWIGLGDYGLLDANELNISDEELAALIEDMKTETRLFVAHIINNNLPLNELYTANYSFLNERLQKHYGFSVTTNNSNFIKANYPQGSSRRGLMTQAAVLAKAYDGSKSSIVKRGVLPLEAFTCTSPEPPTGDVIDAVNMQANSATTEKGKVIERANNDACKGCHASIDPVGWVFTEFGSAGQSVNLDPDGDPLDTSGILFGQEFANAFEMVDVLVAEDKFNSCFANKFLIHSIGRKVNYRASLEDQCEIDEAINLAKTNGTVRARDLIKTLLRSDITTVSGTVEE